MVIRPVSPGVAYQVVWPFKMPVGLNPDGADVVGGMQLPSSSG